MQSACENLNVCGTRIGLPAMSRSLWSRASSGTRRPGSSGCVAGEKTACGACGRVHRVFYDRRKVRRVRDLSCGDRRIYLDVEVRRVLCRSCGKVKQEKLAWLADLPSYTKRFAFWVGRRCRVMSIKDVARETHLDWKTIKVLDKQYMAEQVRRVGIPVLRKLAGFHGEAGSQALREVRRHDRPPLGGYRLLLPA